MNPKKPKQGTQPSSRESKKQPLITYSDETCVVDTIIYEGEPQFVIFQRQDRDIRFDETFSAHKQEYVPLPLHSSYITNRTLLFPTEILPYGDVKQLVEDIRVYIHRYCDVSEVFERIAPYYVLLTYIFENFHEIPYLRVLGDYWSGKSRFLRVVGSICYNPIMVNGGASVASIFRMIEKAKGTLVFDEADFSFSDTTNDIIKLLNNGFSQGNPILRADGENFEPRAYDVFCPKIIGGRMEFRDRATESRCIVETMRRTNRRDIPLNLGGAFLEQSQTLRNKLFQFRYYALDRVALQEEHVEGLEGRLNQILNPILSVIHYVGNHHDAESIKAYFRTRQKDIRDDRRFSLEGMVFTIIKEKHELHHEESISYTTILEHMKQQDSTSGINPRKLGSLLKQFEIRTQRKNTGYVIGIPENQERLERIYVSLGLEGEPHETAPPEAHSRTLLNDARDIFR